MIDDEFLLNSVEHLVASSPRPVSKDTATAFISRTSAKTVKPKDMERLLLQLESEKRAVFRAGWLWTAEKWAGEEKRALGGYWKPVAGTRAATPEEIIAWVRRDRLGEGPSLEGPIVPPRPKSTLCPNPDCLKEIPSNEWENHCRTHEGRPPVAIVPAETKMADGTIVFSTVKGNYEVRPDRLVRRKPDGTIEVFPRCPRCRSPVPIEKLEEHVHCERKWCLTVGVGPDHLHCIAPECRLLGTRHKILHIVDVMKLTDFAPKKLDELIRLADIRPVIVEDVIVEALRKQGRTVEIAKRDGSCSSCGTTIVVGSLIEAVRPAREGPHLWIHVMCPSPSPTSGRAESRAETATDPTGTDLVRSGHPLKGEGESARSEGPAT